MKKSTKKQLKKIKMTKQANQLRCRITINTKTLKNDLKKLKKLLRNLG